jgi:acetyltransferase-like isoleucine patch superfamily enzyme
MALTTFEYSSLCKCGKDVFISGSAEIRRPHLVSIGDHVAIDSGVYITTQADIGDYVHLSAYITMIGGAKCKVVVGDFVTIGAGSRIIAGSDKFMGAGFTSITVPEEFRDEVTLTTINFKRFSGVATNVVIMPGITIAEGSVIAAGSIVTKDTEPWTVYMGSPAKAVKVRPREKMLEYAKKLGYL